MEQIRKFYKAFREFFYDHPKFRITLEYVFTFIGSFLSAFIFAFGYKAFDLTNASIVFLGDNNQFEEILANSATQWCSVGGSGGNSGTGSYGIDVTVRCGGISGPMFNYFVPFEVEP